MKKKVFIDGMSCGHCVARVEKAFKEDGGAREVSVNLDEKNALVELEKDLTDEKIKEILDNVGYDVIRIENL